jgi:hypothetical protein
MIIKKFRAWDGKEYWYGDETWLFIKGSEARYLYEANHHFKLKDVEQFIGKVDSNRVQMYENDIIYNPLLDPNKKYQVIWSHQECGFRKVPVGKDLPITKIDEAFMEVIGTIREY